MMRFYKPTVFELSHFFSSHDNIILLLLHRRYKRHASHREQGFALVMALVMLLLLTLFGLWILSTSDIELQIAGVSQRIDEQFGVAEGASFIEAANVGHQRRDWYQIHDTSESNKILPPPNSAFDPGNDTNAVAANIDAADPATWPWDNLEQNYNNTNPQTGVREDRNEVDYRYLVTLVGGDTAGLGFGATTQIAYKFRVQGAAARAAALVELGGKRHAPKPN